MLKLYYKMFEEILKNIIKCSRCGLCMDVCPIYKAKMNEAANSRGKFLQILGLFKRELKYTEKLAYNLDLCLSCNKCTKFCPSGIDAVKIFALTKAAHLSFFDRIKTGVLFFKIKMFFLKTFYKIKYISKRKNPKQNIQKNSKIAYFNGCMTKANSTPLFINQGYDDPKFACCGLPFYVKGRFDIYEKYKKKNLQLAQKYDKIVFNCATCYETFMNYEGADKDKLIYFVDFYKNYKLKSKDYLKITFHKPCHLNDTVFDDIEKILSNIENVNYLRMEDFGECCGFSGDFFTRHIKTANFLSVKKAENIMKSGADIVLTTCPICLWSLKYGINKKGIKVKALDLGEFLSGLEGVDLELL